MTVELGAFIALAVGVVSLIGAIVKLTTWVHSRLAEIERRYSGADLELERRLAALRELYETNRSERMQQITDSRHKLRQELTEFLVDRDERNARELGNVEQRLQREISMARLMAENRDEMRSARGDIREIRDEMRRPVWRDDRDREKRGGDGDGC